MIMIMKLERNRGQNFEQNFENKKKDTDNLQ